MRVTVIGDCLLDVDLDGAATRLSPDAPVPVVDVVRSHDRAGGAGLVATLLARDGVQVTLVTALGEDAPADRIRAALEGVTLVEGRLLGPTPVKTRVRADGHAITRLDEACTQRPGCELGPELLAAIAEADAVVAADYGRGLLDEPGVRARLADAASRVVWDPHRAGAAPVAGAALVTPNAAEASAFSGMQVAGVADAVDAGVALRRAWHVQAVGVTLGRLGGVLVDDRSLPAVLPVTAVDAADPCGAGDRLAASAAIALAGGAHAHEAMRLGVERAADFLRAGGVATLDAGSVAGRAPADADRLGAGAPAGDATGRDAFGVVSATRAAGGTVVATGGCFDLLHAGHVRTLQAARDMGDCLVVCLNSDASVRRLKGRERPIIAEGDRVDLLLALACVDAVLVFDEDTPVQALRRLTPDLWVKGADYRSVAIPESAVLAEWGGRAVAVPHHGARSSSALAAALAAVG